MGKLKAIVPEEVTPGFCKMALFGKSGSGKTHFATAFPRPYLIDSEQGGRLSSYTKRLKESGGAYFGVAQGANDFNAVIEEIKILSTEPHEYKSLVIDSLTHIYQTAIAREAERLGGKAVFGAEKKPAIAQMRRLLQWIDRVPMNVLLIGHSVSEWTNVAGERKEVGTMPDFWDKVPYSLDLVLRIEHVSKGFRTATVTKSRIESFPEFDRLILQDNGVDKGYDEFSKRYGKAYIEAVSTPIVICSGEQVKEIERLLETLKVSEAEIDKIMSKANVEELKDLSQEQAEKFVKWLTAKFQKEEK